MGRISGFKIALAVTAITVTALVVVGIGVGWFSSSDGGGGGLAALLVMAALLNSLFLYIYLRRPPGGGEKQTRGQRVSTEFRCEVERFLSEMGRNPRKNYQNEKREERRPSPPSTSDGENDRHILPPDDLVARIRENLEILGGYREDLSALLRLYRLLSDDDLSADEKKKTRHEIERFEKVIALSFLLEDSSAVHDESKRLLGDLRSSLNGEETPPDAREEWTPVDLRDQIEQVIRSLPEEQARKAWFRRHPGDLPLVLSRPNTLFEAIYYTLEFFLDISDGGRAIHIRTAQRGDDVWIGVSIGASGAPAGEIESDRRIAASRDLWGDLGGQLTIGEGEVQIVIPMHGPASLFSEKVGREAGEKTS